ncbi:MAG TPA: hypothetical protein VGN97_04395 [Mesorhizobium sp.]|nr:hypothetical protein [Mesorhizobium sp.]
MKQLLGATLAVLLAHSASATTLAEIDAAAASLQDLSEQLPLTQRVSVFVREPSRGYGMYEERENAVFRAGEPIVTYVEPVGYGWNEAPDGRHELAFDVDLKLFTGEGELATEQEGFLQYRAASRKKNLEFSLDLTLTLNEAPAGSYTVEYTVHDRSSGESSSFRQDFEIAD